MPWFIIQTVNLSFSFLDWHSLTSSWITDKNINMTAGTVVMWLPVSYHSDVFSLGAVHCSVLFGLSPLFAASIKNKSERHHSLKQTSKPSVRPVRGRRTSYSCRWCTPEFGTPDCAGAPPERCRRWRSLWAKDSSHCWAQTTFIHLLAVDAGRALNQQSCFSKVQPGVPAVECDAHLVQLQAKTHREDVQTFSWAICSQKHVMVLLSWRLPLPGSHLTLKPRRCPSSWWDLWLAVAGEQICSLWTPWRRLTVTPAALQNDENTPAITKPPHLLSIMMQSCQLFTYTVYG